MDKKLFTRFGIFLLIAILGFSSFSWSGSQAAFDVDAPASPEQADSVFGVQVDPMIGSAYGLDWIVSPAPDTNTHWVRAVDISWAKVEPTPGARVWTGLNSTLVELQNAVNNDLTPIVMVRGVPEWARPAETADYLCSPMADQYIDDFAQFIDDLMNHASSPLKGVDFKYWEFFNEPDIAPIEELKNETWLDCWGDPGEEYYGGEYYAQMLQAVQPVIKTNDPQAQVMVGGLLLDCDPENPPVDSQNPPQLKDCTPSKFLEGILVNGGSNDGGDYFDGVSFHAFDGYWGQVGVFGESNWHSAWNTTGLSIIPKARYIKDLLRKYGYGDRFLMNTESFLKFEGDFTPDQDYETTKTYYLAKAYATAIAEGLRANIWFDVRGDWQDKLTGLVTKQTLQPLPAYYAYQFASQELEGAVYLHDVRIYPGVSGYVFDVGGTIVSVVWSQDGLEHTINLPETPSAIYDVDGDAQTASKTVTVGLEPLYIETQATINRVLVNLPLVVKDYESLINGDFEQGSNGWTLEAHGMPAQVIPSGQGETIDSRSLLLGDPDYGCQEVPIGYAEARQSLTIPNLPAGVPIQLQFKYVVFTQDTDYDYFGVYVNNQAVHSYLDRNTTTPLLCQRWYRIPGPDNPRNGQTTGWAIGFIDLSSYRGQTVTVSFRNYNTTDRSFNTYTYVDDITLEIGQ